MKIQSNFIIFKIKLYNKLFDKKNNSIEKIYKIIIFKNSFKYF